MIPTEVFIALASFVATYIYIIFLLIKKTENVVVKMAEPVDVLDVRYYAFMK